MTVSEDENPLDGAALEEYLEGEFGPGEPFRYEPLEGGNANETFLVRWGAEEFILRKPPVDQPLPDQLHDIEREFEILMAVHGGSIPVPEPLARCPDPSVIGNEFYLMERLTGDFLHDGVPDRFRTAEDKRQIGAVIIDSLVAIHEFDGADTPLEPRASSDEFLEAEISRWTAQLEQAVSITAGERAVSGYEQIAEWLEANLPSRTEMTLIHGDYKPDNLMFARTTPPALSGILDWEMSDIGDPLTDLGWLLSYWADPDDENTTARTYMRDEAFHSRAELVARYETRSGRTFEQDRFYRVLAVYKLAAICEGFFAAHVEGLESTKPTYALMEVLVPQLLARAERIIDGAEPIDTPE